ncbi:putative ubiquitin carboxyl-terminal hydrolase nonstop [Paratrimastix pyriformis]|uniref:Ubiquitin carboxyl-terminal hydrolase n=1 Tax=Paratrimastix pyriformis TaxID=342808 RepID=A0ABQ8UBM7_9EUKA|nr:putative ubiquitin carboxyl-terminal hydrolase nonstop [Paratrimastix pyriformis]
MDASHCSHLHALAQQPRKLVAFRALVRLLRESPTHCSVCAQPSPRLLMCADCVFFACQQAHLRPHAASRGHLLYLDLSLDTLICSKCNSHAPLSLLSLQDPPSDVVAAHAEKILQYPGVRGLYNLGNTCFINAILQALLHNPFLRSYYLGLGPCHVPPHAEPGSCFACEMDRLFCEFYSGGTDPVAPSSLLYTLWRYAPHMATSAQQDAHDCLITLFNLLHVHHPYHQKAGEADGKEQPQQPAPPTASDPGTRAAAPAPGGGAVVDFYASRGAPAATRPGGRQPTLLLDLPHIPLRPVTPGAAVSPPQAQPGGAGAGILAVPSTVDAAGSEDMSTSSDESADDARPRHRARILSPTSTPRTPPELLLEDGEVLDEEDNTIFGGLRGGCPSPSPPDSPVVGLRGGSGDHALSSYRPPPDSYGTPPHNFSGRAPTIYAALTRLRGGGLSDLEVNIESSSDDDMHPALLPVDPPAIARPISAPPAPDGGRRLQPIGPSGPGGMYTLADCLASFTAPESLGQAEPFKCHHCNGMRMGSQQLTLAGLPLTLCIHLKRFQQQQPHGHHAHASSKPPVFQKVETPVSFPLEDLDMAPFLTPAPSGAPHPPALYDLQALVCHSGSLDSGHYVVYVRPPATGRPGCDPRAPEWLLCDDAAVLAVPRERVMNAQGTQIVPKLSQTGTKVYQRVDQHVPTGTIILYRSFTKPVPNFGRVPNWTQCSPSLAFTKIIIGRDNVNVHAHTSAVLYLLFYAKRDPISLARTVCPAPRSQPGQ